MAVHQAGADGSKSDFAADRQIRRAADNLVPLAVQLDAGQAKTVGVGVGIDAEQLADEDVVPIAADRLDTADLGAGHGELMGELGRRKIKVDIITQPAQRDFHSA